MKFEYGPRNGGLGPRKLQICYLLQIPQILIPRLSCQDMDGIKLTVAGSSNHRWPLEVVTYATASAILQKSLRKGEQRSTAIFSHEAAA